MEREWKGWKLNLKTEPTDRLKEDLKRNKEDLKRNKPERGMEEYSFGLGDIEVNGEMKRYQLEMEKYRTWKRKMLELCVSLRICLFLSSKGRRWRLINWFCEKKQSELAKEKPFSLRGEWSYRPLYPPSAGVCKCGSISVWTRKLKISLAK